MSQLQDYFARFCVVPALLPPRSAFERSAATPEALQNGKITQAAGKIMTKSSFAIGSIAMIKQIKDEFRQLRQHGEVMEDGIPDCDRYCAAPLRILRILKQAQ